MDLADFTAAHARTGSLALLAGQLGQQPRLLQRLQWQAATLVERAFWSLCKSLQQGLRAPSRTANSKASLNPLCCASVQFVLQRRLLMNGIKASALQQD